jgi:signal transduction histidine kinase
LVAKKKSQTLLQDELAAMITDFQQQQRTLVILSALSYRSGELRSYLQEVARGVSELIGVDWSVVTFCKDENERILASTIELGDEIDGTYSLHGTVTSTVVKTGYPLVVENAITCTDYGATPEGYQAYLGVPLRTATGKVIGTICSFQRQPRHFTDAEVQLAELFADRAATAIDNYELYQQQQQFAEIGELAAMIVHEVRNPLTTIKMGLTAFQKLQLSEPFQEYLALSLDEADRLQRLLNQILVYAKPQTLQRSRLELTQFITETLNALETTSAAAGKHLQFLTAAPVEVLADSDKLKQVLINLVTNACEAVCAGEVVTVSVEQTKHHVWIQIHNGGTPISADIFPKLMKPFFTTKPSGTGLGLAIVQRIIEAHDGEFTIESSASAGTIAKVKLPVNVYSVER